MTKSEKMEAARVFPCPRCHAAAGNACRSMGGRSSYRGGIVTPRNSIKTIHEERLMLVDRFSREIEEDLKEDGNDG